MGGVICLVDGPLDAVKCTGDRNGPCCPLKDNLSLLHLRARAKAAVEEVHDNTSFRDLVEEQEKLDRSTVLDYCI